MPASASDHELASELAVNVGTALVTIRNELVERGINHWDLKDAGDAIAHQLIMEVLGRERPDDAVLSEEGADDLTRLDAERVWIVDPLDGTREFAEPPRIDWAVHIALVENGVPIAGAVSLPAEELVMDTANPPVLQIHIPKLHASL